MREYHFHLAQLEQRSRVDIMQSMNLGNLRVTALEDGLELAIGDEPAARVVLTPREIGMLENFLETNAPRERRVGFRVPFGTLSPEIRAGFAVQIHLRGRWFPVEPVDLSLTGILVQSRRIVLPVRVRVGLALSFDGISCRLTGEVVRRDGHLVALHFLESISKGDLDPPEELLAIYRKLEQEWLRRRVA